MGRLVLSRYPGESIDMFLPSGERIEIQPVHVGFGKVRLSIDAPGNVRILRREVADRISAAEQTEHEQESEGDCGNACGKCE